MRKNISQDNIVPRKSSVTFHEADKKRKTSQDSKKNFVLTSNSSLMGMNTNKHKEPMIVNRSMMPPTS